MNPSRRGGGRLKLPSAFSRCRTASAQDALNALLAPKHSPVFTGVPRVPAKTGIAGDNADLPAAEAQVYAAALAVSGALALKADIDSPALTGIPRTPRPDGSIAEQTEQTGLHKPRRREGDR